jgi:hypothetical protein
LITCAVVLRLAAISAVPRPSTRSCNTSIQTIETFTTLVNAISPLALNPDIKSPTFLAHGRFARLSLGKHFISLQTGERQLSVLFVIGMPGQRFSAALSKGARSFGRHATANFWNSLFTVLASVNQRNAVSLQKTGKTSATEYKTRTVRRTKAPRLSVRALKTGLSSSPVQETNGATDERSPGRSSFNSRSVTGASRSNAAQTAWPQATGQ